MDKKIKNLSKDLSFYHPWLKWHMEECDQNVTIYLYRDELDERFSFAVVNLNEKLANNIEDGDPFELSLTDPQTKKVATIRGQLSSPSADYERQLIGRTNNVIIRFLDKNGLYSLGHLDNVTITKTSLRSCYRKQMQNILNGLKLVAKNSFMREVFNPSIYKIRGIVRKNALPTKLTMSKLELDPRCNESQKEVVLQAVNNKLTLVKGPPGTGKTFTSSIMVYNLHKSRLNKGCKILVCASSNVAVDNLAIKLLEMYDQLDVVRIRSMKARKSKCKTVSGLESIYLDNRLLTEDGEVFTQYRELLQSEKKRLGRSFDFEISTDLLDLEKECEKIILKKADVICSTCNGVSRVSRIFQNEDSIGIDSLVIDECGQVSLPEALLAIKLLPRRIVLVGDDKQLGVVINQEIRQNLPFYSNGSVSLFDIVKKKGFKPILLNVQYRMHPNLAQFSNKMFYQDSITHGVEAKDRHWPNAEHVSPFPKKDSPIYFHCHNNPESKDRRTFSTFNKGEVDIVMDTIKVLLARGVESNDIGVITFYRSQCEKIRNKLNNMVHGAANSSRNQRRRRYRRKKNTKLVVDVDHIEVDTVDAYQGREKDYIILSMVRSCENGNIGFIADKKRLNVSLTRARYGIIIAGNPTVLKREGLLSQYLNYLSREGLLYDEVLSRNSKSITLDQYERQNSRIKIPTSTYLHENLRTLAL